MTVEGEIVDETKGAHEDQKSVPGSVSRVISVEILKLIRDAQQQHGLRHGDYQRYRGYCTRRIRRLRKVLSLPQGDKRHFKRKDVTESMLKDERFLYIPLMMAERAWAYGMQLRQEANTELRKKFHLIARLRKATIYALQLEKLCESENVDARTKLEAQAYVAWIHGSLHFELQLWKPAMENLKKAQMVYEKLASALSEDDQQIYRQRVDELSPSLRYCAYNIGDETAIDDLLQMRGQGTSDLLSNIDTLITQTREKRVTVLSEVSWHNHTIPVTNEKVRLFLMAEQELSDAVARATDQQTKISLIENFLMDCKDAITVVKEELKNDANTKVRVQSGTGPVSSLKLLLSYLIYIRLTRTIERNLIMVESMKKSLAEKSETPTEGRKTRPQDLIRLYEIILQNLGEIQQLAGLEEDFKYQQEVEGEILSYRAFRCFYIAQTLGSAKKWREAMVMFQKAEDYVKQALKKGTNAQLKNELEQLQRDNEGQKFSVHAHSVLAMDETTEQGSKAVVKTKKPLSERLHEYYEDPSLTTKQPNVYKLPPDFQPIPCKPLFFDLALNLVEFPSLDDKLEQKKQAGGLTGFVKGFLGWGGKK